MNVSQPATRQSDPVTVVPRQREAADPSAAPVSVDHVRKHGRSCYWDVADCRWRCG